jgi:hypothetical protein
MSLRPDVTCRTVAAPRCRRTHRQCVAWNSGSRPFVYNEHGSQRSPPVLTQLKPPLPLETSKGPGWAHFVLDYGPESSLLWVVFMDKDGACWTVPQSRGAHVLQLDIRPAQARGDCRRAGRARRNGKDRLGGCFALAPSSGVCRKRRLSRSGIILRHDARRCGCPPRMSACGARGTCRRSPGAAGAAPHRACRLS